MKVVITGASGNVGTAVLRTFTLTEPETELVGVSRRVPGTGAPYALAKWQSIDVADARSAGILRATLADADAVVCLSWLIQPNDDELRMHRTNVDGTWRVFDAAVAAGVRQVVYVSSVGAYSPGPAGTYVDESWPTDGIPGSAYSRDKAEVETLVETLRADHPEMTVTVLRPALVFQHEAASEIARYFLGPLAARPVLGLLRLTGLPFLPMPAGLHMQFVHASDVADAVQRAVTRGVNGTFNLAAEPAITPELLAHRYGTSRMDVPPAALRAAAALSWRLGLQPTSPGWVDLAAAVPTMSSHRARAELDWQPTASAEDALDELLTGLLGNAGTTAPPLRPRVSAITPQDGG